jgi:hypothetical protein
MSFYERFSSYAFVIIHLNNSHYLKESTCNSCQNKTDARHSCLHCFQPGHFPADLLYLIKRNFKSDIIETNLENLFSTVSSFHSKNKNLSVKPKILLAVFPYFDFKTFNATSSNINSISNDLICIGVPFLRAWIYDQV